MRNHIFRDETENISIIHLTSEDIHRMSGDDLLDMEFLSESSKIGILIHKYKEGCDKMIPQFYHIPLYN